MWEATTEHARECILEDKLYSYCSEQGVVLLFNCIYELVGTIMNGNCYSLDELTATQKVLLPKLNFSSTFLYKYQFCVSVFVYCRVSFFNG